MPDLVAASTLHLGDTTLEVPVHETASEVRWLGLSPVLFGMGQAVGHGIIFPRLAGDKYSPGFLASALLHVPIGLTYIRAVQADRPLTRAEWAAAIAYTVAFAAVGVAGPNAVMHDKNSPYAFTAAQMGHHDIQAPAGDTAGT